MSDKLRELRASYFAGIHDAPCIKGQFIITDESKEKAFRDYLAERKA